MGFWLRAAASLRVEHPKGGSRGQRAGKPFGCPQTVRRASERTGRSSYHGQGGSGDWGRGLHRQSPGRTTGAATAIGSGLRSIQWPGQPGPSGRPAGEIQAEIEVHRGDLKDPEAVRKAVQGPAVGVPPGGPDRHPLFLSEPLRRGPDQRAGHRTRAGCMPGSARRWSAWF